MPDISEPELNRIERLTRDYVLPALPSDFNQPAEVSDKKLDIAKSILAKEYVEHAKLDILWKTFAILIIYDIVFQLNSKVYGLAIAVLGSIALALPDLYTPELLAEEIDGEPRNIESEIRDKAERSVKTNVGVAGLVVGFLWQLFTISGPLPLEIVSQNYLQGRIPNWLGFLAVVLLWHILFRRIFPDIRNR